MPPAVRAAIPPVLLADLPSSYPQTGGLSAGIGQP